jgi:hypothetical protein
MPELPPIAVDQKGDFGGVVWKVREAVEFHWRDWGGDSVVYEARSGQILQFDPLAAAVMGCFEEAPLTASDVCANLANDIGGAASPDFSATVGHIVDSFRRLGWLEPIIVQ